MTHTYQITGMTCANCEAKVKSRLLMLPDVTEVSVSKEAQTATITMKRHIALAALQKALGGADATYRISASGHHESVEQTKNWLQTYRPILLIFGYIMAATVLVQVAQQQFSFMHWMQHFMAGFFLVFSFFKLLDLKGFEESYTMYDVIARRFRPWAYLYPFIELLLGLAYLVGFEPVAVNWATVAVMGVSLVGVLQSVLNKRQIRCACLGAVFNLPMSTITILEDALMIAMSVGMLTVL